MKIINFSLIITSSMAIVLSGCTKEPEQTDVSNSNVTQEQTTQSMEPEKTVATQAPAVEIMTTDEQTAQNQMEPKELIEVPIDTNDTNIEEVDVEFNQNDVINYGAVTQLLLACEGIDETEFAKRRDKGLTEDGFTSLNSEAYLSAFNKGVEQGNAELNSDPELKAQKCAELIEFNDAMHELANTVNSISQ